MNELLVTAAIESLNLGDVSELTDEQITEKVNHIKSLKVYTEDSLKDYTSNVRKDFRGTIEKEVKGSTMEKFEKNVLEKYGLELKQGEDYSNAIELIEKVISGEVSKSSNDEELKKELTVLQEAIKKVNEDKDTSLGDLATAHKKALNDLTLNGEISKYSGLVDVDEEKVANQMEFLRFTFDKQFEIREQDGKPVVFDKIKDEIVKNEDFSPESLSSVMNKLASTTLKLKKVETKEGRGKDGKPDAISDMAKFKTEADFYKYLSGQEISPTSTEAVKLYSEWKKAS